jgi:hypothetical protein
MKEAFIKIIYSILNDLSLSLVLLGWNISEYIGCHIELVIVIDHRQGIGHIKD